MKWNELVLALIGGGVLTAFVNNFLYRRKIINGQKVESLKTFIDKRINALMAIKEFRKNVNTFEILEIGANDENIHMFNEEKIPAVYPAIFENRNSIMEFITELNNIRQQHEEWVDCETAAYLVYIQKYFLELTNLIRQAKSDEEIHLLGAFIFPELQKWSNEYAIVLNKKINKISTKMEAHSGKKWEKEKQKVIHKFGTGLLEEFEGMMSQEN